MRTYKRTSKRGAYGSDVLQQALQSVKNGVSLIKVSRETGVPARTLRRHRDGKVSKPAEISLGRYNSVFSAEVEAQLVEHIMLMERALFGLTTHDVRKLAFEMAERMKIQHPFNKHSKLAGSDWLRGFLSRHQCLSIREPTGTSINRAIGFNRTSVNKFQDMLVEELEKKKYSPVQVWNMDETGLSTVQKPGKILAPKGKRQIGKMTSSERGQTTTVICAISASGSYIPPLFIFARKCMNDLLMKGSPAGSIGMYTSSGWTDSEIFVKWLQHFVSVTRCSPEFPALIILDGHHSHKTLQAIDFAREHGITLLTLPPHSTHKLQPLDKCFFGALKSAYNVSTDSWLKCHPGKRVTVYDVTEIFSQAYGKCATVEKATTGFAITGIWPFQKNIFSDEDFEASRIAEFQPTSNTAVSRVSDASLASVNSDVQHCPASSTADEVSEVLTAAAEVPAVILNSEVQGSSSSSTADEVSAAQILPGVPSALVNNRTEDCHPGLKEALQILNELSPRPKVRVEKKRKRKLETCAILTSSPYKLQLAEKQQTAGGPVKNKKKAVNQADEDSHAKSAKRTKSPPFKSPRTVKKSVATKEKTLTRVSVVMHNPCKV